MPIKKPKKRRSKHTDSHKVVYSLELLNYKTLLILSNYLERKVTDETHSSMEALFKNYKNNKDDVHKALLRAFKFLVTEKYVRAPDDPPYYQLPEGPPPSTEVVKAAKAHINRLAKKVWKK